MEQGNRKVEEAAGGSAVVERILTVVGEEVGRVGPDRVRMGVVAERAKVSRASLYRYFASKDDLILAFTMREVDRIFVLMDDAINEYEDWGDRVCAAFTFAVTALDDHEAFQTFLKYGERRILQITLLSSEALDHARDLTIERFNNEIRAGRLEFDPFDAMVAAEIMVRLGISMMSTPNSVTRLATKADTMLFAKRYIVPVMIAMGARPQDTKKAATKDA